MEEKLTYSQKYYRANREKLYKRQKEWKKNNPDKVKQHTHKYYLNNKDKKLNKAKKFRKEHPIESAAYYKKYRTSNVRNFLIKKLVHLTKKSRKYKDRIVDIDIDYLLALWDKQQGKCAITGYSMTYIFKNPWAVSIDRIDSAKGYLKDNIQLVCVAINFAKNNFKNEDILKFWNDRPNNCV